MIHIPEIGEILCLDSDWTFTLYPEDRNSGFREVFALADYKRMNDLIKAMDKLFPHDRNSVEYIKYNVEYKYLQDKNNVEIQVTLPAKTTLRIDRIYIRKGKSDFSSLTFIIIDSPDKKFVYKKNGGESRLLPRFWAKLEDVNKIDGKFLRT